MSSEAQQLKELIINNLKIVSKDEPGNTDGNVVCGENGKYDIYCKDE